MSESESGSDAGSGSGPVIRISPGIQAQVPAPNPFYARRSLVVCSPGSSWIVPARRRTLRANGLRLNRTCLACRCHASRASWGMYNPRRSAVLEHAIEIAELARPLVAIIQRKDRDLASQLRRAVSSIALNAAEAQGNAGGNSRVRYESALGSQYEAQAGVRVAVAWRYISEASANEVLESLHSLGGRVFGLCRR